MKRNLKLFFSFARFGLLQNMEFRFDFLVWMGINLMWSAVTLVSVEWIFGHTSLIAGWTKYEVLLLVSVQLFFVELINIFVTPSLQNFTDAIRDGKMDFYLIKPVNLRYLVSVSVFESGGYVKCLIYAYLIFHFSSFLALNLSLLTIILFISLLVIGLWSFYNLFFILSTSSFWLTSASNINYLFSEILEAGRFPTKIFRGGAWFVFLFVFPIGFIATFPTGALLGRLDLWLVVYGLLFATLITIFSQAFWNFALKRYSSASS